MSHHYSCDVAAMILYNSVKLAILPPSVIFQAICGSKGTRQLSPSLESAPEVACARTLGPTCARSKKAQALLGFHSEDSHCALPVRGSADETQLTY